MLKISEKMTHSRKLVELYFFSSSQKLIINVNQHDIKCFVVAVVVLGNS